MKALPSSLFISNLSPLRKLWLGAECALAIGAVAALVAVQPSDANAQTTPATAAPVASAPAAPQATGNMDAMRKTLEQRLGVEKIDELTRTPYGLIEIRVGTEILYADMTGTYLIAGNVIDMRTKENLTQARTDKLTSIAWKDLPLQDAIKIVKGKGTRQVAMFEDPNCGYCRLIHQHFTKVDDVTMYVFLLPILSPDSGEKSKQIWCSADRGKAWLDWMLDKKLPTGDGKCATPNDRVTELGRKYKVTGTPTIVFTDGQRVPGAIPPEQIEKRLASIAK
jgi:thiol:disulfide interchange protein DsbC